ncbi:Variant sh3 domain containing protein [Entamoeba marina]
MSFQTNLMGNLEFVFKHASHNIKFSTEMAEFFDKIHQSCYGTVKTTLEQLLKSLQLEAEGQMKVAETLSEAIEEFKAQIKDVEKGSKALKQDADLRLKEVDKCKDGTKKEKDKFLKYHKELESAISAIKKGETDGVVEKKMKTLEDKRDHYKEKEDDQCKVYTTSVETTNKPKTLSPNDDVVTFCEENDTARRTPSYLPVVDASGLILKQEGALGLRRADDPKGLERVYLTCQTTHDFTGETPEELDIKKGDIIIVSEKHQSGWWYATFKETGKGGFVPETYVKDLN